MLRQARPAPFRRRVAALARDQRIPLVRGPHDLAERDADRKRGSGYSWCDRLSDEVAETAPEPVSMSVTRRRHAYIYGDYLAIEVDVPKVRHEFVDGEILAMAGGSDLHSALIAAVSGELYRELRGTPCGAARLEPARARPCDGECLLCRRTRGVRERRDRS